MFPRWEVRTKDMARTGKGCILYGLKRLKMVNGVMMEKKFLKGNASLKQDWVSVKTWDEWWSYHQTRSNQQNLHKGDKRVLDSVTFRLV